MNGNSHQPDGGIGQNVLINQIQKMQKKRLAQQLCHLIDHRTIRPIKATMMAKAPPPTLPKPGWREVPAP